MAHEIVNVLAGQAAATRHVPADGPPAARPRQEAAARQGSRTCLPCMAKPRGRVAMAVFLFLMAAIGVVVVVVVVGDLVLENPSAGEVTVFNQPVSGYSQGML